LDAHLAAHALGAFANDRQADAGSGIVLGTVQSLEHMKNALLMFAGDADAVVLNP
jgi:hypothetical protein